MDFKWQEIVADKPLKSKTSRYLMDQDSVKELPYSRGKVPRSILTSQSSLPCGAIEHFWVPEYIKNKGREVSKVFQILKFEL